MKGQKSITIAFLTQGCFELYKTGEKSIEIVLDMIILTA
jgi:hypothetical protein